MKELVIGTTNPTKKLAIQAALRGLGIVVKGTDDLGLSLDIPEDGQTAQANARLKSVGYSKAAGCLVLSVDNALYLNGLSAQEQPGIHTRRVPSHAGRATDDELLAHYTRLIQAMGGRADGHWEYAVCIATPEGRTFERTFLSYRKFVGQPSPSVLPGYPLESIQIEPESGLYISEMSAAEQDAFWQRTIGRQLMDFVAEVAKLLSRPEYIEGEQD